MLILGTFLTSCKAVGQSACPVTEPEWAKSPKDSAVVGTPDFGYYIVNQDHSIWASAWWAEHEDTNLKASGEGNKVGWFRPAGTDLAISGKRIDAKSASMEVEIPCCYPTRFQSTGLSFPGEGCWEITAAADDRLLTFVVWVEP